jgi:hypothetical protein
MAGHEIKECNVAKDGVCALHGVEVERRRQTAAIADSIPGLVKNMNRMIGYLTLVSLVIIAGFVYIRDVKNMVDNAFTAHKSEVLAISAQLSVLTTTAARSEEKNAAMMRELENLNSQIYLWISKDVQRSPALNTQKRTNP